MMLLTYPIASQEEEKELIVYKMLSYFKSNQRYQINVRGNRIWRPPSGGGMMQVL